LRIPATDFSRCHVQQETEPKKALLLMGGINMTFAKPARLVGSMLAVALCCGALLDTVPASAQAVVIAPMAPPPPRVEVAPAPRPGYMWDQGRWRWEHGRYVWAPGHWQPVRAGYRWVPGHWAQRGPHWRWIEGHWA
jgi:hypothetical protein